MATLKTFDSQALENIYEEVKNHSTSAAYTFKQLQLKYRLARVIKTYQCATPIYFTRRVHQIYYPIHTQKWKLYLKNWKSNYRCKKIFPRQDVIEMLTPVEEIDM